MHLHLLAKLTVSCRLALGGGTDVSAYTREVCPWMLKFCLVTLVESVHPLFHLEPKHFRLRVIHPVTQSTLLKMVTSI